MSKSYRSVSEMVRDTSSKEFADEFDTLIKEKEKPFQEHLFSYRHDGKEWTITVMAESREDAEARMRKLPLARYEGVVYATIPAAPGVGLMVRAWCWWKNFWK